jgi:hypothetical protein
MGRNMNSFSPNASTFYSRLRAAAAQKVTENFIMSGSDGRTAMVQPNDLRLFRIAQIQQCRRTHAAFGVSVFDSTPIGTSLFSKFIRASPITAGGTISHATPTMEDGLAIRLLRFS